MHDYYYYYFYFPLLIISFIEETFMSLSTYFSTEVLIGSYFIFADIKDHVLIKFGNQKKTKEMERTRTQNGKGFILFNFNYYTLSNLNQLTKSSIKIINP